jgi:hypothetical protein
VLADVRRAREAPVVEERVLRFTAEVDGDGRALLRLVHAGDDEGLLAHSERRVVHHHVLLRTGQPGAYALQRGDQRAYGGSVVDLHAAIVRPKLDRAHASCADAPIPPARADVSSA